MPASEHVNGGSGGGGLGAMASGVLTLPAGCRGAHQPNKAADAPFHFHSPRCLIDWRVLHAIDIAAIVRNSDIDALESVLDVVHSGDIEAEDARNLTPANFIQLFRVAQLTLDYLLYVQDRLAADSTATQGETGRLRQQVSVLQLKVKELREELAGSRKETRHMKKSLRSFEALALARQHVPPPPPPPEVRVVERVVEMADPAAAAKLQKLEAQLAQLTQERQDMQRDNSKLADAVAAAVAAQVSMKGSSARAVECARREEREAAAERLQAALEEERRRHRDRKAKLSVVVSSEGSPGLQSKLEAAQRREREAEQRAEAAALEAAHAAAAANRAAAVPVAEARRLRTEVEAAQAEADMLRSKLARVERERSPSRAGSCLAASGLGAELEDADDARMQQLEDQVESQRAQLAASDALLQRATARCKQLEQLLHAAQEQHMSQSSSQPTAPQAADRAIAATVEVLQQEVECLRAEKAQLREECRRLRQQAAHDTEEIAHLSRRLLQVVASRGGDSKPPSCSVSPTKAAAADARASTARRPASAPSSRGASPQGQQQRQQPSSSAERGIGSPIEGDTTTAAGRQLPANCTAGAYDSGTAQRPGSRPSSARGRQQAASPTLGSLPSDAPTAADMRQFRREMQHTLHHAERPGVVSRFPHSLGSFLALRPDLQEELEAELAAELSSYGLDPDSQQLTNGQLEQAMAELEHRRSAARRTMTDGDRRRMDYMRSTATWHVQRMAELAGGHRDPSPVKRPKLVQAPILRPIRTASKDDELDTPRRRGFVEQVLDQVGDEDATYSPLARGASVLSDHGYLDADVEGTPRSPWSASHYHMVQAGAEMQGRRSPLGHSASPRASPSRLRAARSVQFSGMESDGDELVPAQRIGRRPSFTSHTAGAEVLQSPRGRRAHRHVEEITPAEPWGSRDWDTGEAAPVRPSPRRTVMAGGPDAGLW